MKRKKNHLCTTPTASNTTHKWKNPLPIPPQKMTSSMQQGLETLLQSLTCPICHQMYEQPTTVSSCTHTFCYSCISQSKSWLCPVPGCGMSIALRGDKSYLQTHPQVSTIVTSFQQITRALSQVQDEWWKSKSHATIPTVEPTTSPVLHNDKKSGTTNMIDGDSTVSFSCMEEIHPEGEEEQDQDEIAVQGVERNDERVQTGIETIQEYQSNELQHENIPFLLRQNTQQTDHSMDSSRQSIQEKQEQYSWYGERPYVPTNLQILKESWIQDCQQQQEEEEVPSSFVFGHDKNLMEKNPSYLHRVRDQILVTPRGKYTKFDCLLENSSQDSNTTTRKTSRTTPTTPNSTLSTPNKIHRKSIFHIVTRDSDRKDRHKCKQLQRQQQQHQQLDLLLGQRLSAFDDDSNLKSIHPDDTDLEENEYANDDEVVPSSFVLFQDSNSSHMEECIHESSTDKIVDCTNYRNEIPNRNSQYNKACENITNHDVVQGDESTTCCSNADSACVVNSSVLQSSIDSSNTRIPLDATPTFGQKNHTDVSGPFVGYALKSNGTVPKEVDENEIVTSEIGDRALERTHHRPRYPMRNYYEKLSQSSLKNNSDNTSCHSSCIFSIHPTNSSTSLETSPRSKNIDLDSFRHDPVIKERNVTTNIIDRTTSIQSNTLRSDIPTTEYLRPSSTSQALSGSSPLKTLSPLATRKADRKRMSHFLPNLRRTSNRMIQTTISSFSIKSSRSKNEL